MNENCMVCGTAIDTDNDEHYCCDCTGVYKAFCTADYIKESNCPDCGEKLRCVEASITKRLYEEPGLREMTGY